MGHVLPDKTGRQGGGFHPTVSVRSPEGDLDVLQEQLEGSIDKEIGIFIAITKVLEVGEGEIVPGDGAVYYDVNFESLVLRLKAQEVIEGMVVETTSFGAFVSLGPIDAMLHVSQISDEHTSIMMRRMPG